MDPSHPRDDVAAFDRELREARASVRGVALLMLGALVGFALGIGIVFYGSRIGSDGATFVGFAVAALAFLGFGGLIVVRTVGLMRRVHRVTRPPA